MTEFLELFQMVYTKFFSVLDPKNSFSVINQSRLRDKTSYQEKETFDIMSNIFPKYRGVVIRSNKWVCIRSNKCGSIRSLFWVREVGVYKVHLFYLDKVSLFEKSCIQHIYMLFCARKWVFIRSQ